MSVTSGFFDSKNKDRLYNTEQLSSIFDGIIKDGVYMGYEDAFIVKATDPASLTVNVGPGRAWFHHTWTHNDAPLPIVVKQGDVVLDRIDSIIIDIDKTEDVRSNKVTYLEGSPSSEPTAPVLVNEEKHWQIPLCDVSMPAGSTTITQAQITNRIGTSDCPFVTGIIETIDTDELLAQWNAEYREWYERVQQEIDQWTEQEQEDFTNWMNGRKTEFDEWFAGIQDILDGDTAGNLLNRINHRTGINATAAYSAGVVAITAPDDAGEILTFVAPSDFLSSDTYTLNGEALTITDLNGEALEEAWKKNSPITITVSGGKAFFKSGGSGSKNDTLPPLLGNMTVEVVEGDENDTYTIKMDKLILDKTTEMVGGAQLEWGEEMPEKPGKGTGGIKTWTRDEVITTGKPYDGLYLGDVTPSDAVTETLIYLPENIGGKVVLSAFIILSTDYLGGVYITRLFTESEWLGAFGTNSTYAGSTADNWFEKTYLGSILHESVSSQLLTCDVPVMGQGTVSRRCWPLSSRELDSASSEVGGEFMPYFSTTQRRISYLDGGTTGGVYWMRTKSDTTKVFTVTAQGGFGTQNASYTPVAYRPCFVLPKDFKIQQRPDGSYTVWNEQGLMTLGDVEPSTEAKKITLQVKEAQGVKSYTYLLNSYDGVNTAILSRDKVPDSLYSKMWTNRTFADYSNSDIMNLVDSWATSAISTTLAAVLNPIDIIYQKIQGTVTKVEGTVSKATFLPSAFNIGGSTALVTEGSKTEISYFKNTANKKFSTDSGSAVTRIWTRDASKIALNVPWAVTYEDSDGSLHERIVNSISGIPCGIVLISVKPDSPIRALADGTYDLVPEDPALSGTTKSISVMAETSGTPIQLKDIPVSDADNTSTLILPEKNGEQAYIYVSENYEETGAACAFRGISTDDSQMRYRGDTFAIYTGNGNAKNYCDVFVENYLDASVLPYVVTADINSYQALSSAMQTVSANAFPLAAYEMGYTDLEAAIQAEGPLLPYFDGPTARADERNYYTRTGRDASNVVYVTSGGGMSYMKESSSSAYIRPAILLSPETWFTDNGDGTYTFVGDEPESSKFVSHTVEVPHGQKVVFRQFTQNQKKQFQTMLVGGVYPPLGGVYPPLGDEGPAYSEVLAENTWEQIAQACADRDPILDSWLVGDEKDEVINGETLTFAIVGKDHDDKSDGTGKAKLTFGMTQLMNNTRQMNGSKTNAGSFAGSALYAHLRDTILPGMPEELRAAIKPVNKPTSSGSQNSTIRNDSMSLWLFSEVEIFGRTTYSFGGEGFQYPYFATAANRVKRLFNGMGEVSPWWERSPYTYAGSGFCCVTTSGAAHYHYASTSYGVCFGFCIG